MQRLLRFALGGMLLAMLFAAAPRVQAGGVACYHCECAKCVPYLAGYSCDYVLENKYCDCQLWGFCNYNPTYCTNCSPYPWANSCRVMNCGAPGQEACAKPDLRGIQVIQEDDAALWKTRG
jgi:hypothetical protein